jgi:hypothetical protein
MAGHPCPVDDYGAHPRSEAELVEYLRSLTSAQHDYNSATRSTGAWTAALRLYPAHGRDLGAITPRLFEEDGRAADGLVSFFRRACENAYHDVRGPAGSGNGPAIRHFTVEMVRAVDDSGPARRARPSQAGGVMAFHRHRAATSDLRQNRNVNFEGGTRQFGEMVVFGFTTVELHCERCGALKTYRVLGDARHADPR